MPQVELITNDKDGSLLMFLNGTEGGQGSNNNTFSYIDLQGNTYSRVVSAAKNVILVDRQGGSLNPIPVSEPSTGIGPTSFVARRPGGKVSTGLTAGL